MRLLLDTHAFLWWLEESSQLSTEAELAISNIDNEVFVSAVVIWEIGIKSKLGKLDAPENFEQLIEYYQLKPLPISIAHAVAVQELPPTHGDPFDRMLIAQALVEDCILVTSDAKIQQYGVRYFHAQ